MIISIPQVAYTLIDKTMYKKIRAHFGYPVEVCVSS